jgi:murein L,D-transpeptidase YcbB/YkuD
MERERWLVRDRGARHVWVNLADFSATIRQDGREVFRTRAVIGKDVADRETPEFSDEMDHLVLNPSWYVPRSIIVNEYLPKLRANPNAVRHLKITDRRGREVDRGHGFAQYSARSFPFSMRQPPGPENALGRVKFMFPNPHNIYLHDTPQRHLFAHDRRAYSHGCIRLAEPVAFAHAILAPQEAEPEALVDGVLRSGAERRVDLDETVPVHLVYRTAFTDEAGALHWREDVYGRDAMVLDALIEAGVTLGSGRGA